MKKILIWLTPPGKWKPVVAVLMGIFCGLAAFVFYISKAPSYLSDNPETCINCHVMNPQFATWAHSSHRQITNCNECHVPHNNVFHKYAFKMQDGLRHATIFTMRTEPQVIQIREAGKEVVQANCVRCHDKQTGMEFIRPLIPAFVNHLPDRDCMDCHREMPHGTVKGQASTPYARVKSPDRKFTNSSDK